MKLYRNLIFILVLIAIVIWMDLPSNPGIHILNINRAIQTRLGLDLVGGVQALLEADLPANEPIPAGAMSTARQIVENRVNGLGVSEAVVQQAGERRIVVELPGETDPQAALATIQQTGLLEFVDFSTISQQEAIGLVGTKIQTDFGQSSQPEGTPTTSPSQESTIPSTPQITPTNEPTPTTITPTQTITSTATIPGTETPPAQVFHTIMTGIDISNVSVTTSTTGQYEVSFQLTTQGSQIFSDYTSAHVGDILAIVLDKTVISAPRVDSAITGGRGVITGNFTLDSANALAVQLRYGSLPIPLKVVTSQTVGPTLGQDSLNKSLVAGMIGLGVVVLFMGLYYRLPGILADLALFVYALITFALFRFIPVTLTLPGIAGFVLSVGVAVDANVLIFERLKEELRSGRNLRQAIDLGWSRAWPSIRDSNFSTLITCLILFWFGSTFGASIVKGFALTLAIGVLVSMFTAIIVTRSFLHVVLDNIDFSEHHVWFGV
jgi:preprotein translocase subunit SecD